MSIYNDLRWGTKWGLLAGVVYSGLGALVYTVKGNDPSDPVGVSLGVLVTTYILGGITGGGLLGLLRPLTVTRRGSSLVGVVASIPVCMGFLLLISGPVFGWGGAEIFSLVFTAVALGGYGGYTFWDLRDFRSELNRPSQRGERPH